MGFMCDSGDGNDAVIMLRLLEDGADSQMYCGQCVPLVTKVMADMMGVAEVEGGTITDGQLVDFVQGRLTVLAETKGSKPVIEAREAELETVIRGISALLHGEDMPAGTLPTPGTAEGDSEPPDDMSLRDNDPRKFTNKYGANDDTDDVSRETSDGSQERIDAGVAAANAAMDPPPGF